MATQIWVNIDSGNGLLPDSTNYLNQCGLLISEVLQHSHGSNFTVSAQGTVLYEIENNYDHISQGAMS